MRTLSLIALVSLGVAAPAAQAQDNPAGRTLLAAGVGFAVGSMSVGGGSASASGPTGHARLGVATGRRTLLILDAELQPFEVENPLGFEAFRSMYVLAALQQYLSRRIYLRGGAGVQFRKWSGSAPVTSSDAGVALGFAIGGEVPVRAKLAVTPEFVVYAAFIEAEGSVSANLIGLRSGIAWHR